MQSDEANCCHLNAGILPKLSLAVALCISPFNTVQYCGNETMVGGVLGLSAGPCVGYIYIKLIMT